MKFLLLLLLALIASACGFKKYVYFISIGYGAAIALIGAGLLVIFRGGLTIGTMLQSILFIAYGVRLAGYITFREVKTSYNRRMKGEIKSGKAERKFLLQESSASGFQPLSCMFWKRHRFFSGL